LDVVLALIKLGEWVKFFCNCISFSISPLYGFFSYYNGWETSLSRKDRTHAPSLHRRIQKNRGRERERERRKNILWNMSAREPMARKDREQVKQWFVQPIHRVTSMSCHWLKRACFCVVPSLSPRHKLLLKGKMTRRMLNWTINVHSKSVLIRSTSDWYLKRIQDIQKVYWFYITSVERIGESYNLRFLGN